MKNPNHAHTNRSHSEMEKDPLVITPPKKFPPSRHRTNDDSSPQVSNSLSDRSQVRNTRSYRIQAWNTLSDQNQVRNTLSDRDQVRNTLSDRRHAHELDCEPTLLVTYRKASLDLFVTGKQKHNLYSEGKDREVDR